VRNYVCAQEHGDWQARAVVAVFYNFGILLLSPRKVKIKLKLMRLYCTLNCLTAVEILSAKGI